MKQSFRCVGEFTVGCNIIIVPNFVVGSAMTPSEGNQDEMEWVELYRLYVINGSHLCENNYQ